MNKKFEIEEKNTNSLNTITQEKDKAISVENLSVSIGDKNIISEVSFDIHTNEFVSIIGANGSGKTTLLKTLCKIIKDFEGNIFIKGKLLSEYQLKKLARIQSYVSQINILSSYTVSEFVLMSRYSYFNAFTPVSRIDLDKVNRSL